MIREINYLQNILGYEQRVTDFGSSFYAGAFYVGYMGMQAQVRRQVGMQEGRHTGGRRAGSRQTVGMYMSRQAD